MPRVTHTPASTEIVLMSREELRELMQEVAVEAAVQALAKVQKEQEAISREKAAEILGVSERTIVRLHAEGKIEGKRVGRTLLINSASLNAMPKAKKSRQPIIHT